jgi:hypothetical protein
MHYMAELARAKLSFEAAQPDPDFRLLIGHKNMIEHLVLGIQEAEDEQQKSLDHYVWADTGVKESSKEDASASDDPDYGPGISTIYDPGSMDHLAMKIAQLGFIRTPSCSSSRPFLLDVVQECEPESTMEEVQPLSEGVWYRGVQRGSRPLLRGAS